MQACYPKESKKHSFLRLQTDPFAERQNLRDTMKPIQHDSAAGRIPRTRNRMRWIQSKLAMGAIIRSATWDSWRPKVACILPLPSSAGMEIEYCSKIQALSHQKACQSTTAMRWRSGIGAEVLLDNQRYQRNDLKEIAWESVRIHTQHISTYPNQWQRLQHLDAVATSLKLQPGGTNSIEIIVLPFWKWMNTYGYSQVSRNPEPTSCNFKAHVVAASKMYWHMEPPMFSPDGSAALRPLVQARPQRHHLSAWSSQEVLIEASVSRSYVACDPHWEPLNRLPLPASQWCW